MAQELRQSLKLTQQLVMTPQLQQAIKLLQLTRLELADAISQELLENPVLEEIDEMEEARAVQNDLPESVGEPEARDNGVDHDTERLPTLSDIKDIDWRQYFEQQGVEEYQGGYEAPEDREEFESPITKTETLADHLEWQVRLSDVDDRLRVMAIYLVGEIDDDGYLKRPLAEIAEAQGWDIDDLEEALAVIQEFDPPGVGARDLRECLLLQLRQMPGDHATLRKLVENHLHDLETRNYNAVMKAMNITSDVLSRLLREIGCLEPKPGRPFGGKPVQHIVPDIYVVKVGDDYEVLLNDDGLPKLRVSNYYKDMIAARDAATSKKEREYIQEKLRSAMWMIRSIHQRQRTIYKVTQSIVKRQRDFFDRGAVALSPMVLRDVAEDIEMHESTVSRATTNKYVHTPQGIYELKFFFNSGIDSSNGDQVASEAVKQHIHKLISSEDPKKPFSDQEIVEILLKKHGIVIARRTVTKYRELLGILSSSKRRRVL